MGKKLYILFLLSVLPVFSWEFVGPGDSTQITNLHCFGKGHLLAFVTKTQNNNPLLFRSRDYGASWDSVTNSGLPRHLERILNVFEYDDRLYCSPWGSVLYFSSDSGNTWIKDTLIFCGANSAFSHAAKDSIFLIGSYCFFSRSTDNGKTWQNYIDMPWLGRDFGNVLCMMTFRDVVYAGTQYGIFASRDWGLTWEKRGKNFDGPGGNIFSLGMIDTIILMSNGAAASVSYDLGQNEQSWLYSFLTGNNTFLHITSLYEVYLYMFQSPDIWTLHHSKDTGKTYQPFSITTPEMYVHNIKSDDKYVYVMGTKGIYRNLKTDSPVSVASYTHHKNSVVTTVAVYLKNGKLFCVLKQSSSAEINLFSLAGRRVFSFRGQFSCGASRCIGDLRDTHVGSGVYMAEIRTPHQRETHLVRVTLR